MRRGTAEATVVMLLVVFSVAALWPFEPPRTAADPWVVGNPDGTSDAVWNFTSPADYVRMNTEVSGGSASLLRQVQRWNTTAAADFAGPDSETNIDRSRWPGSVALASTSGTSALLTLQPGPTGMDSYMDRQSANTNHGADPILLIDGRGPDIYRPILRFDLSTIPGGVVIDEATLSVYMTSGIGNAFTATVHHVTAAWDEAQVTWNERIVGTAWATPGGDYDPHAIAVVSLDNAPGWKTANLTQVVDLWYRGRISNYGIVFVPPNPGAHSDKTFHSSEYVADPTLRPKLDVRYRVLGATGSYVSKVGGPGTLANWQTISWNATSRSLISDEFSGTGLDPKWTWTNPPPTYDVNVTQTGHLHIVSGTGTDLNGGTFTGHVLSDGIVGDFTATLKFTSNPTVDGQKAGLLVLLGPRDWYMVQKTFVGATASVNWQATSTADASSAIRASVVSGNPNPAWLRVVRTGTTFAASTSSDGGSWTPLDTYTPAYEYPLGLRIAVVASDGLSGVVHTVDVDYLRMSLGADATTTVQTRLGDTNPVDATWTGWSVPYPAPSGSPMAGTTAYADFRLTLSVTYPDHTPVVGDVNLSWSRYAGSGTLETADLVPADLGEWGDFRVVEALNGQTITYAYSLDSGGSWTPVSPPASLQSVSTGTGKIRFQATLATSNTLLSPTVSEMRLTYRHRLDHFTVAAPASAMAGAPFSMTVTAKDAADATLAGWTGTVTLDARRADGTTPGDGVLGTTSLTISSGGSATLATQTYTKADVLRIRASFGGAEGLSGNIDVGPGPIVRIAVAPDNVTLLFLDTQSFAGSAFDAYDNPVPGASFTWAATGGVGTLNTTVGSSVSLTTGTAMANGTVEASAGGVAGSAQVRVVLGTRPWIAITSPAPGDHVRGAVPIVYTNSSSSVAARFEYDDGSGWTVIGATAILSGTFLWDTTGIDFTGGTLRATVEDNRTVTNATLVSPLEVDNTPPTIRFVGVVDAQATSGTLTIAYTTDADTLDVDLAYFNGSWNPIGRDPTVDGTYVWTPGGPVNGVTLRGVATDDVGFTGMGELQGVGNRTVGASPPRVEPIPELRVRVGSLYVLNLTFYLADADTPLASLGPSVSDPANVTLAPGAYPDLRILYGTAGTYVVTLWVTDGTDTAWTLIRIVASGTSPPRAVATLPGVLGDEDVPLFDAAGAPLASFFTDDDGDPLSFSVLDAFYLSTLVNGNGTLDLTAPADWSGTERLRIRASDPSGGFAEAALSVTVRSVNDAPILAPIPTLEYEAGTTYVLDLTDYVSDVDTNLSDLLITTDSPYIVILGFDLRLRFPSSWERTTFTLTVFDGAAAATQQVEVILRAAWWGSLLFALPSAGAGVVIAMVVQRSRWRPAKAFLVDEYGQLLREFTLDPACRVTYDEVVHAGVLDAQEEPIKVARYHALTVAGDALAVVLLAYGPVTREQIDFAREMLVNIQDKFDERVRARLEDARTLEAQVEIDARAAETERGAITARSKALAGVLDAVTAAQTKLASDMTLLRSRLLDVEDREARLRHDRDAVEKLSQELSVRSASIETREREAEELFTDATTRSKTVKAREKSVAATESTFAERQKTADQREAELAARDAALSEKALELETRAKVLGEAEARLEATKTTGEALAKENEGLRAFLDARSAQVQSQEAEVASRMASLKELEERWGPIEAEISRREAEVTSREETVRAQAEASEARAIHADETMKAAREIDARAVEERRAVEVRAKEIDERSALMDRREADLGRLEGELAGRARALKAREERVDGLETDLKARLASMDERAAKLVADETRANQERQEIDKRTRMLNAFNAKVTEDRDRLEAWQQALDARNAELGRRVAEVTEREDRLGSREKEVAAREEALGARDTNLAGAEDALRTRETELHTQEAALAARGRDLETQRQAAESLEANLVTRGKDLDAKAHDLDARAAQLEARLDEVQRLAIATDARASELDVKARELTDREAWLAKGEAGLGERGQALQTQAEELKGQEKALAERLTKIELLESAIAQDRAVLQKDRQALDAMRSDFETRSGGFAAEMQRKTQETDERRRSLEEDLRRFAEERSLFDGERTQKSEWIASKEIELEAREQSLVEKEAAMKAQGEENARRLAELAAREEALEIDMDKLEKERTLQEKTRADVERMASALETKAAGLHEEETRKAEELRTWHATLESEQALLRQQKDGFEKELANQREMWADRMLRVQMKEEEVAQREAKIRSDIDWIAKNDDEIKRREKEAEVALGEARAVQTRLAEMQRDLETRAMEVESRERSVREEAAQQAEALVNRQRALEEERAALEAAHATFTKESAAKEKLSQETDAQLRLRAQDFDRRDGEARAAEERIATKEASLRKFEDALKLERADNQMLGQQLHTKQREFEHAQRALDEGAAKLQADTEAFRQAVAAKEAELQSQRERVARDSNVLQERLGAKAQELANRERVLAVRESEVRSLEQELEARIPEVESRERQVAAQTAELQARDQSLANRQRDLDERASQLEGTAEKLALEEAQKRREWQTVQKNLKTKAAQVDQDANTRFTEINRQMAELESRERALTTGLAQLDVERAKLADAAKAQAQKDADAAAAWARSEKRLADLQVLEQEILRRRQEFEADRSTWERKRAQDLKQLEETRDAAGEQASQAERLVVEAQRRMNAAQDAERSAKRQGEELSAIQAQLEMRRAEAENAQRALREQTAQFDETSRKLAVKDKELADRATYLGQLEAQLAAASQQNATVSEDLKTRQRVLEHEAIDLAKRKADLESQAGALDARSAASEAKLREIMERERVLNTELARAENLMIDLGRKEAELQARGQSLAATEGEISKQRGIVARKEAELTQGMQALDRMREDIEARLRSAEEDRKAASSTLAESNAVKDEAEKAKAQAEAMQAEVSKNMKFLQKKAVDVLDREEQLRGRDLRLREAEKGLEARAQVLEEKERQMQVEKEDFRARITRLEADAEKLRAKLEEAEKVGSERPDTEAAQRDIEMRVKIIQKKAFDLLDREEKLRKREQELRARAEQLGVEI